MGLRPVQSRYVKALTLVEVLVVVAVIAVLLALLLPAMGTVRARARRTACLSNLRQIAIGYTAYLNDHDGRFYGSDKADLQAHKANYAFGGWKGKYRKVSIRPVNAYLGIPATNPREQDARLFRCPADTDPIGTFFGSLYQDFGNSYQTNRLLVIPHLLPADESIEDPWRTINARVRSLGDPIKMHAVRSPQYVLWIGDYPWMEQWDPLLTASTDWHGTRGHHCMVFLDGHAGLVGITRGLYTDSNEGYRINPVEDPVITQMQRVVAP